MNLISHYHFKTLSGSCIVRKSVSRAEDRNWYISHCSFSVRWWCASAQQNHIICLRLASLTAKSFKKAVNIDEWSAFVILNVLNSDVWSHEINNRSSRFSMIWEGVFLIWISSISCHCTAWYSSDLIYLENGTRACWMHSLKMRIESKVSSFCWKNRSWQCICTLLI